jgi:hypothetical protein
VGVLGGLVEGGGGVKAIVLALIKAVKKFSKSSKFCSGLVIQLSRYPVGCAGFGVVGERELRLHHQIVISADSVGCGVARIPQQQVGIVGCRADWILSNGWLHCKKTQTP